MPPKPGRVKMWATYTGRGPDGYHARLGFQPEIPPAMEGLTILALWKQEMHRTQDEKWRKFIAETATMKKTTPGRTRLERRRDRLGSMECR
jgi:hypothetical protein